MNILAVDNEPHALISIKEAITEAVGDENLTTFTSPLDALEYARKNKTDVAFLDIDMPGINGLHLAKQLKDIYGKTNIIFVTSYSEYANKAFDMHASGYVMKPIDPKRIKLELENLRNTVPIPPFPTAHIRCQCFGSFTVLIDNKPLLISRSKPKELLAYLVNKRGAAASSAEIASILWEDKEYDRSVRSNVQNVIARLIKILKEAGIADIIIRGFNTIAIDTSKISCDYYEFLEGNVSSINTYNGTYMQEYSWAEFTIGQLEKYNKK